MLSLIALLGFPVPPGDGAVKPERFQELHRLIRPQAGELKFWEVPWLLGIHEARRRAAAERKPILVWAGAGGPPIGVC